MFMQREENFLYIRRNEGDPKKALPILISIFLVQMVTHLLARKHLRLGFAKKVSPSCTRVGFRVQPGLPIPMPPTLTHDS